jgi:hypothetical protein
MHVVGIEGGIRECSWPVGRNGIRNARGWHGNCWNESFSGVKNVKGSKSKEGQVELLTSGGR